MSMQISADLLDGVVLSVLERNDAYGYALTQEIQEKITVSPSTLYPVLRRLLEKNLLETYDKPISGRNRRYYRITADGRERQAEIAKDWHEFRNQIEYFITIPKKEEGGSSDDE